MFVIFECNSAIPIRNAVSTCVFESVRSSWGLVLAAWLLLKGMVRQAVWGTFVGPVIQSLRFHSFSLSLNLKILAHDHACSALENRGCCILPPTSLFSCWACVDSCVKIRWIQAIQANFMNSQQKLENHVVSLVILTCDYLCLAV